MFKNPFSFEGRIRRLEYGLSYLIYVSLCGFISIMVTMLGAPASGTATIISLVLYIPAFWFMLAQGAKRCHDRGNSGIWQIIPFYQLWMFFADGEIGGNEYGLNPKHLVYEYFPEEQGKGDEDLQPSDTGGEVDIIQKKE
ncbi:DUF805 domain-containing protein [Pedobacter sp. GR22-6]|uniref:DUF805 domain-containing protein n=1 Tax=Pedobacter sp. GR22-6 TaxID=3127957 RepID=UPI00307D2C58